MFDCIEDKMAVGNLAYLRRDFRLAFAGKDSRYIHKQTDLDSMHKEGSRLAELVPSDCR